jgi:hypothetical protein
MEKMMMVIWKNDLNSIKTRPHHFLRTLTLTSLAIWACLYEPFPYPINEFLSVPENQRGKNLGDETFPTTKRSDFLNFYFGNKSSVQVKSELIRI